MRRSLAAVLGLVFAAAAAFTSAGPMLAEHEPPRLGLTPIGQEATFFELTVAPGETRDLQVDVANFGHDEAPARTYAADAYPIVNGGLGAELFGEESSGTTLWVDYDTQEVTLRPGDAIVVGFRVAVPEGTAPGEYLTSIVVENAVPYRGSGQGDIQFEQTARNVIAIAIDVPGPREPELEIGSVGHKIAGQTSTITFEVRNTGNVHLKPSGNFLLRDAAGTEIASAPLEMDSVYAGMGTLVEAPLAVLLVPAAYCAELALTDAETGVGDDSECLPFTVEAPVEPDAPPGSGPFQGIPVLQPTIDAMTENPMVTGLAILIALGTLLLAIVVVKLRLRRRRRGARRASLPASSAAAPARRRRPSLLRRPR